MAEAVNYMINLWKSLENVLKCGRAEISNQSLRTVYESSQVKLKELLEHR